MNSSTNQKKRKRKGKKLKISVDFESLNHNENIFMILPQDIFMNILLYLKFHPYYILLKNVSKYFYVMITRFVTNQDFRLPISLLENKPSSLSHWTNEQFHKEKRRNQKKEYYRFMEEFSTHPKFDEFDFFVNKSKSIDNYLIEFDFPTWKRNEIFPTLVYAIDADAFNIVKYVVNEDIFKTRTDKCLLLAHYINFAMTRGNLEIVKFLYVVCYVTDDYLHYAVQSGNIELVEYIRKTHREVITESCFNAAAKLPTVEMLKYLIEELKKIPTIDVQSQISDQFLICATQNPNLSMIQYVRIQFPQKFQTYKNDLCRFAVHNPNLKIFDYLRNECSPSCEWDVSVCRQAARDGKLNLLKYVRENFDPPCPWDQTVFCAAGESGKVEVFQYLLNFKNPCHWDPLPVMDHDAMDFIVMKDHLEAFIFLKNLKSPEYPCDPKECIRSAFVYESIKILKYLVENETGANSAWKVIITNSEYVKQAAWKDLNWFSFMLKITPLDILNFNECIIMIIRHGYLPHLKYLLENYSSFVTLTKDHCLSSVICMKIGVLKYLHENNCPYDKKKLLDHLAGHQNKKAKQLQEYVENYM